MKNKIIIILLFIILFPINIKANTQPTIYLFYSEECPHCKEEIKFLNELKDKHQHLNIIYYEISNNENSQLLKNVKYVLNSSNSYIPYTVIGTIGLTGYNDNIRSQIEKLINKPNNNRDIVQEVKNGLSEPLDIGLIEDIDNDDIVNVPVLGKVNAKSVSLPLLAIIIGAVDGFNPCAMWILILLISTTIAMKDKKKMLILGLIFILTSALVYMLLMISWLKITMNINNIIWIRNIIALLALTAGIYNITKFIKALIKKDIGCEVTSNKTKRKTLSKLTTIIKEKSLILSIIGIILLAISVNIVEIACSAGLPLLFTQILSLNELTTFQYFSYILLYILFFLIDDLIIFLIAITTFKISTISNKFSKYSNLVGGLIMIIIGLIMLISPNILMS